MAERATGGKSWILIVDDDRGSRLALRSAIESLPVEIMECDTGESALRSLLNQDQVAMILLDVQLPHMDGFEIAAAIRARPAHRHTPILFLTGIQKEELYVARGYELGAIDYMFKPVVPEFLRAKVRVFCDLFEKTQALEQHAENLNRELQRLRSLATSKEPSDSVLKNEVTRYTDHLTEFLQFRDGHLAQKIATELFDHNMSAKHVVEIHLEALDRATAGSDEQARNQIVQEARLLLLGIMVNLADMYKASGIQFTKPLTDSEHSSSERRGIST